MFKALVRKYLQVQDLSAANIFLLNIVFMA